MEKLRCESKQISTTLEGHSHAHAHIIIPLTEPMYLCFGSHSLYLSCGQIAFVPPACYHEYHNGAQVLLFNVPAPMIKKYDLIALKEHAITEVNSRLAPLITLIRNDVEENPNCDSIRYLFYYLYDKLVQTNRVKSLQYISEHFSEDISVAELAAIENYTPSYYSEWFRRKTGVLPSSYLQRIRIDKAKELLVHTRYQILDIAFQTGYSTNSTFTRAFKELEGMSPRQYRALYWSGEPGHDILFEHVPTWESRSSEKPRLNEAILLEPAAGFLEDQSVTNLYIDEIDSLI